MLWPLISTHGTGCTERSLLGTRQSSKAIYCGFLRRLGCTFLSWIMKTSSLKLKEINTILDAQWVA